MAKLSRTKGVVSERFVVNFFRGEFGGEWSRKKIGTPGADIESPKGFPYCIEVKDTNKIRVLHLFHDTTNLVQKCWTQASAQADALDLAPLLVVKSEGAWFCTDDGENFYRLDHWCRAQRITIQIALEAYKCQKASH